MVKGRGYVGRESTRGTRVSFCIHSVCVVVECVCVWQHTVGFEIKYTLNLVFTKDVDISGAFSVHFFGYFWWVFLRIFLGILKINTIFGIFLDHF